jgi:hypothetical protein
MRIILTTSSIDKLTYDVNNNQSKQITDTDNIIGFSNSNRSQFTFKNINLYNIFGADISNKKTFNIKIKEIKNNNEQGKNIIDYLSRPHLRTCNLFLKSNLLTFLNGKNENIIGQFTNIDRRQECEYRLSVRYDVGAYKMYVRLRSLGSFNTRDGNEFIKDFFSQKYPEFNQRLMFLNTENNALFNSIANKAFTITATAFPSISAYEFTLLFEDGTTPNAIAGVNNSLCSIVTIPTDNQWFILNDIEDTEMDTSNIELTACMPTSHLIDLTFELRDIMSDQLQPVVPNDNKVYPNLVFVLDIY